MKNSVKLRAFISLLIVFSMLSPAAAAWGDGKKFFKNGMKHEIAEEWDQAVEQFALAVNENPRNPEYRLHLQRALFNASQMYMRKGKTAADQKDYEGAYLAFRKAYAFDPTNQLAESEMARMARLQEEQRKASEPSAAGTSKFVPAGFNGAATPAPRIPQRFETLRDLPFPGGIDLQTIVKDLAKDLELNVLFDVESRLDNRRVKIDIRNISAAKGLDYIFMQEGLFFQRVGPRTILVASNNRRMNLQQLVLRTFYLSNANPKEVKTLITQAIPPQPGRSQTIVLDDEPTNSLTIRDTEENVRLIGRLISSLDKDRAEVVMDVAIYEVNKSDLLQFGNQLGTAGSLANIGGVGIPLIRTGPSGPITGGLPGNGGANPLGYADAFTAAIGLPISNIRALQSKGNTKLVASTQIHAFNNQDSSARIGQRVPVRTATFAPITNTGGNNNNFLGDVYNYEQVGLTLKFKPIVFPNQDVQVVMEIESKDVAAGISDEQPRFIERTIKGTARVQNNKTLLLASVAQNSETKSRTGLPLVGLIPILGRLFTAPTRDNSQTDIVMAITPRVIRAPAILPEDEVERITGSVATPTSGSLEDLVAAEEREELLAAERNNANRPQTTAAAASEQPAYVPAATVPAATVAVNDAAPRPVNTVPDLSAMGIKPIDSSVKGFDVTKTALTNETAPAATPAAALTAAFRFAGELPELKAGEKYKAAIMVDASANFRSAVVGLKFDDKKMAIRSVSLGDLFGADATGSAVLPFLNQNGKMFASFSSAAGSTAGSGVIGYIEIEALESGRPKLSFEKDVLNLLSAEGKNFTVRY